MCNLYSDVILNLKNGITSVKKHLRNQLILQLEQLVSEK